jgi:hypothetical protein
MHDAPRTAYARYEPWRRVAESGYWIVLTLFNAAANSITALIDIRRAGLGFATWEPVLWEWSSGLAWLALIPGIAWFTRRYPLHWAGWRAQLLRHLGASVVVSLLHVLGMVAQRVLVYRMHGLDYDFGWSVALGYEYLKDIRSYASIVVTIEAYRLVLRRMRGEVRLLDAPDEPSPGERAQVERPERFLVRKLGREFLVAADEVEWLQASGNYVNLRVRGHDYPLRSTIGGIQARLDPARFVRIHRSYIVNLEQVASIEPMDSGDARAHLRDGSTLPVSRRYRGALRPAG